MSKAGKRFTTAIKQVDRNSRYKVDKGMGLVVTTATAKFDEAIDVAVVLGVDPKQSDQQVRGAVDLPHGAGKTVRVNGCRRRLCRL
jgi:large subunit ribosomal protein L1